MTISCRDTDIIPKVEDSGKVYDLNGESVQIMHDGTRVIAGGYCGDWMTKIIFELKGHHEPQEELVFHEVLKFIGPDSLMIELGANWAYYTNWFLGAILNGNAICIEPDADGLSCGQKNLSLNGRNATFIRAAMGKKFADESKISNNSIFQTEEIPLLDFDDLLKISGHRFIDIIHIDIQGAEFPFIESMKGRNLADYLRFVFVSTHHLSISGSANTHEDCINMLKSYGASILIEHSIEESFSGDGLIVASFRKTDESIKMPDISRNVLERSLFG